MAMGAAEKIIKAHLTAGKLAPGKEVTIRVDQTLTQDATGTIAYLEFEEMGVTEIKTELSVSYIDHNTGQNGFENADDHHYLQTIARKYGIYYSRAGNGICHQVHLERFARPGKTLLGSDSHTPTAGGIGMLAIGAGGLDVSMALAKGEYSFKYPRIILINLEGRLKPWVSAKDIILTILKMFTSRGNAGNMIEYGGNGLKYLSVPERAVIANMGAETGITTSVFPSDDTTKQFLRAQSREKQWQDINADPEAKYDKRIEIKLNEIVPMAACPHSPDNVVPVQEIAGKKVDQVIIGSCTNSSYRDLKIAANILKGKKIHSDLSLVIAPGSRQVLKMIADEGILSTFIEAGGRIAECTCGFCIGNGFAPGTGEVSVRTSNRNFKGRCGTESAFVYLSSPETAAATAISGVITNPCDMREDAFSSIALPDRFVIDDSMIISPSNEGKKIEISRGPNIGEPPHNEPFEETINAKITIKVGDKITTDHIMPAGSKLKYRSNIPKYAESVFEPVDPSFPKRCRENISQGYSNIIAAGLSYGQGSSREHAAICPMYLGVKVVIAKSIERIHASNLVNFGILPLIFKETSDYEHLETGDIIEINGIRDVLTKRKKLVLRNKTKGIEIILDYELTEKEIELVLAGGLLNYIRRENND